MKPKAVLVDIDGTLVSVTPNWSPERDDQWVQETLDAVPLEGTVAMLQVFKLMGYQLVFLTARGQNCRSNTWKKFRQMKIDHMVDSMWHRPLKYNGLKSCVYKEKMIEMLIKKYDFEWAIDDEDANLDVMAQFGMKGINAKIWW